MANSITHTELDELSKWLEKPANEQHFYDFVRVSYAAGYIMGSFNNEEIKKGLLTKIRNDKRSIFRAKVRNTFKYAAIILVFLALGLGVVYWDSYQEEPPPNLLIEDKNITLQLANGDTKIIKEDGSFEIVNENGEALVKQNGGRLDYSGGTSSKSVQYNQLNVPFGKKFQLTLSDGTQVYLNAGSTIRYPIEFIESEENRQVFLEGEGYFDVARDKPHPFIVNTNKINVKVFGTRFNVSSYSNDPDTHIVLVEGSVGLHKNGGAPVVLMPGQKGEFNWEENGEIQVENVNTFHYTSWMKGELLFRKSSLGNMLRTLERHYNITIVNTSKDLEDVLFNASFRNEPIENILTYLDDVLGIEYSIEDNMVIIH